MHDDFKNVCTNKQCLTYFSIIKHHLEDLDALLKKNRHDCDQCIDFHKTPAQRNLLRLKLMPIHVSAKKDNVNCVVSLLYYSIHFVLFSRSTRKAYVMLHICNRVPCKSIVYN